MASKRELLRNKNRANNVMATNNEDFIDDLMKDLDDMKELNSTSDSTNNTVTNTTESDVQANVQPEKKQERKSKKEPTTKANDSGVSSLSLSFSSLKREKRDVRKDFRLTKKAADNLSRIATENGISENEIINKVLEELT